MTTRPHTLAVQPEHIPAELKALRQWVVWRYENREGKWTKPPLNPRASGRYAKATDPATWGTYQHALRSANSTDERTDGIGFVLTTADPYTGIDIDHCADADTGELTPEAQEIVRALASYTEYSPSGTGVHIFIRGALRPGMSNRKDGIEIYTTGRFLTITGHRVPDTGATIEERQDALAALHARLFPAPPMVSHGEASEAEQPRLASPLPPAIDDVALIERARGAANGAKFTRIWGGDSSDYGGDESSGDLALCGMLAFWTGGDAARIERLFRQSGRMREKWNRPDYRDRTIAAALAGKTEFYGDRVTPIRPPASPRLTTPRAEGGGAQLAPITDLEARREARRGEAGAPGLDGAEEVDGTNVVLSPARDGIWKKAGTQYKRTHSWCPTVHAQVIVYDGSEGGAMDDEYTRVCARWYDIEAGDNRVIVSHGELVRGDFWERLPVEGTVGKANTDMLANVVRHLAKSAPVTPGFDITGWHRIVTADGETRWGYVTPDGTITPPALDNHRAHMLGFDTDVQDRFARMHRGLAPFDRDAAREALDRLWEIAPHGHIAVALGAAIRSVLTAVLAPGFAYIAEGASGTGKTSTLALAIAPFAPYSFEGYRVGSFTDTDNALELQLARHASFPAIVDDLAPPLRPTPAEIAVLSKKIDNLVRPVANDAPARQRARRDGGLRRANYTRTVPFITAERLFPTVLQSLLRRAFVVQYVDGDIDIPPLREHGKAVAAQLASIGHTFLTQWGARMAREEMDALAVELGEYYAAQYITLSTLVQQERGGNLPDIAGSVISHGAHILVGLMLLDDLLALDGNESMRARALPAITAFTCALIDRITEHDADDGVRPFTRIMQSFLASIRAGQFAKGVTWRIDAYGVEEQCPRYQGVALETWGWKRGEDENGNENDYGHYKSAPIAYADASAGALYLTGGGRDLLRGIARDLGYSDLAASDRALLGAAQAEGWIVGADDDRKRHTTRRRINGTQERVVPLRLDWYVNGGEAEETDAPEGGKNDA